MANIPGMRSPGRGPKGSPRGRPSKQAPHIPGPSNLDPHAQTQRARSAQLGGQPSDQGIESRRHSQYASGSWYGREAEFNASISPSEGELLEGMRSINPHTARAVHQQFGKQMRSTPGFAAGMHRPLYGFSAHDDPDFWEGRSPDDWATPSNPNPSREYIEKKEAELFGDKPLGREAKEIARRKADPISARYKTTRGDAEIPFGRVPSQGERGHREIPVTNYAEDHMRGVRRRVSGVEGAPRNMSIEEAAGVMVRTTEASAVTAEHGFDRVVGLLEHARGRGGTYATAMARKGGSTYSQATAMANKAAQGGDISAELKQMHESGEIGGQAFELMTDVRDYMQNPGSSLRQGKNLGQRLGAFINPALAKRGVDVRGERPATSDIESLAALSREMTDPSSRLAKPGFSYKPPGITASEEGTVSAVKGQQAALQDKLGQSTAKLEGQFNKLSAAMQKGEEPGFLGIRGRQQAKQFGRLSDTLRQAQVQAKALDETAKWSDQPISDAALSQQRQVGQIGAAVGAIGAGGGIPGITGPPGRGTGGTTGGVSGKGAPLISRAANLLGGFEMMYIQRMMGFATGAMGRGISSLADQQAAIQGGLFMGGAMPAGYQGEVGEVVQRQARGEAAWAGMGRQAQSTYGDLMDFGATLPGQKVTGFGASVVGPTMAAVMAGTHFGGKIGGVPGAYVGAAAGLLGVGGFSTTQWLKGQGTEETIGDDYMAFLAGEKEWTPQLQKLYEQGQGIMQQGGLGGDALGQPFWSTKELAETPWRRTFVGMLGEAQASGSPYGDMAMKLGLLDRSNLYDEEGNEMPGLIEAKKRSMASWRSAMGGGEGFMEGLTAEQISDFSIIMGTDPTLSGIDVKAMGQALGQFTPYINRGAMAGQGTFERLATQVQMGGDPYGAMQSFGALGNVSPIDYGSMSEMVDAISKLDGEDMAKVKSVAEMFKAISQPLALATGSLGYQLTPGTPGYTTPMGDVEATSDQLRIDPNIEALARSPGGLSMYQKRLGRWQARAAWDPTVGADEGPRPEDFAGERYNIRTAEGRQRMMEGMRQEEIAGRYDQIAGQRYWAGPAGRGLLLRQTQLQAQNMTNQMAQQWALAPGAVMQQQNQAQIQMATVGEMARYTAGGQLAGMQANIPYQRALGLYQGREQAGWQTFQGGIQSQFGFTGDWDTAQANMRSIAGLGVSPNVSRQLSGMPYGAQMAEAFGGGTQGAAQAVLFRQGRGMTGMQFNQQEMWDLQGTNAPTSTSLGGALYYNRAKEDAMYGLSVRGMQLREDRFEPQWAERTAQFNLQRERQLYGFDYQRESLTSTSRGARAQQALSMRGLGLQERGLDLGMAQFGERFGMQSSWAQTQFENQQADLQRQRDQQMQMRTFAQADMPLQRRQFEMSQIAGQQRIQFQEADIGRQRGYQLADISFQQAQTARQFGHQIEDVDENIRFSTGRGRRRLLRQRGRMIESRNIQTGREDEMEDRRESEWEIEDERFKISKDRAEEMIDIEKDMYDRREERIRTQWAFEDTNFGIRQERMQEARDHQVAMMDMQKRHFEEQHALQRDQFALQKERAELQQKNIDAQLAHLAKQEEFAQRAHDQAETRMAKEKEHAEAQLQLQKDQIAAGAMFRDQLRTIADDLRKMEHDRIETQGMWAAMAAGVDPSSFMETMFGGLSATNAGQDMSSAFLPSNIITEEQEKVMEVWRTHYKESGEWGIKAVADLEDAETKLTDIIGLVGESVEKFELVQTAWGDMGVDALSVVDLLSAAFTGEGGGAGGAAGGASPQDSAGNLTYGGGSASSGGGFKGNALGAITAVDEAFVGTIDEWIDNLVGDKDSLQSGWEKLYATIGMGKEGTGGLGKFAADWNTFFTGEGGVGILSQMELLLDPNHLGGIAPEIKKINDILVGDDGLTSAVDQVVTATEAAVQRLLAAAEGIETGATDIPKASGFHGLVRRGDYLMRGGQRYSVAENGAEWMDIWPNEASGARGGGGDVSAALNGMKVQLVVDGNQMDGYLRTRERTNLYRESFR